MPTARRFQRRFWFFAASSCAGLIAGCSSSAPTTPEASAAKPLVRQVVPMNAPDAGTAPAPLPPTPLPGNVAAVPAPPQPAAPTPIAEMPPVPADANWTLFCFAFKDVSHIEDANRARTALIGKTNRRDWYVIHGRDESNLYFGFYASVNGTAEGVDPKRAIAETERSKKDHEVITEIRALDGNKPFERSVFVALESPDPTSPPEWNLYNVDRNKNPNDPSRAYWSLQVAAFRVNPLRKEAAVEMVRDLREKGLPAYYFHGEFVSSVCIGAWPVDAVKQEDRSAAVGQADPKVPIVASNQPMADSWIPKPVGDKKALGFTPGVVVADKTLMDMSKKFPYHAVNYEIGKKTGENGKDILDPSFLVEIPRAKGNGLYDNPDRVAPAPIAQDRLTNPTAPGASMLPDRRGLLGSTDQPDAQQPRPVGRQ